MIRWRSTLLLVALAAPAQAGTTRPSVAFFYGKSVPVAELSHFDWVVVQPEHLDTDGLAELQRSGVRTFAYLSLGEAAPGTVEPSWILGSNRAWGTVIVNPAVPGWRERIVERADALWKSGYRGLFLDTLDSYLAALPGAEARRAAAAALAGLVRAIHDRHPDLQLFFNRGFEILDEVGRLASGLAAESLLFGWDATAKRFVDVPEPHRKWLADQLQRVRDRFGIPVVVVDYLPPARRAAARDAARRIEAMGFTPWIATPALDILGVGSAEIVPRRVLMLYDGAETPTLEASPIHRLAALPVEYLGCAADYADVRRGLPTEPLAGRYAGIVTWFTDDEMPDALDYQEWLLRQIDGGVPVAIFGRPGFAPTSSLLARLGLAAQPSGPSKALHVLERDGLVGFEAEPSVRSRGLVGWRAADPEVSVHLRLVDAGGQSFDPVVTAPWGGMALDPYLLDLGYQGRTRWIVDPFSFLEKALRLEPGPALDLTTENGARLLVVVADGEGFARPARDAYTAAEVILGEVLSTLPVATTVAMRVDEPGAERSGRARSHLETVTRAMFALPYVEPASQAVLLASGNPQYVGEPSVTQLSPSGYPSGDLFRVYLPGWNESGASSWWEARDFDVDHLVELALRADTPRRLKAIGFYYHFWIATKPAALRSLKDALSWVLERGALPLWSSEYARRVSSFRSASIAHRLDGSWQFGGLGPLRTVRVPRSLGWPDLLRSRGVASVSEAGDWRYVSFGPEERPTLVLSDEPPRDVYLAWANARLDRWSSAGGSVSLRLQGHQPIRFAVGGSPGSCTLTVHGRKIRPARAGGQAVFSLASPDTGDARLECGRE